MGPESSSEYFIIGSTIQSTNTSLYLNIGEKIGGKSYLQLSFGATANTTAWGLEGDTVITTTGSGYGRREFYPSLFGLVLVHSTSFCIRIHLMNMKILEFDTKILPYRTQFLGMQFEDKRLLRSVPANRQ